MSQDKAAVPDSGKSRSSNSGLMIVLVLIVVLLCLPTLVIGGIVVASGALAFWAVDREAAPMNVPSSAMPADSIEWNMEPRETRPDFSLPAESQPIAPPSIEQE